MHSCFFLDTAGLFLKVKKISEFFVLEIFLAGKFLRSKFLKPGFLVCEKKFRKFLGLEISKPENFWLIKFFYRKSF